MGVLPVVVTGAMVLAAAGALFGVVLARVLWTEDLRQAIHIDEIRSRTETSLRGSIAAQERMIALKDQLIVLLKSRLGEQP